MVKMVHVFNYRKFSNKGATPHLLTPKLLMFWTFFAISQPKMVRFSFCKNPLELLSNESVPLRRASLLGNFQYIPVLHAVLIKQ